MQGQCIIFSAPSGAGKTTIVKRLIDYPDLRLEFSISATSRSPRNDERNGIDYYFLSPLDFQRHVDNGNFAEWEEVYAGTCYGTLKSELHRIWDKNNIVVFDVDAKGGLNLKKMFGPQALSIFVMPPSIEELENRLRGRNTESEEKIKQRMARAEFELSMASQFDVQLVNDNLEQSVSVAYNKIRTFISD